MKVEKYRAPTMREAVAQVKADLGADAMVVSTREVRRGFLGTEVEVTAVLESPKTAGGSYKAAYGKQTAPSSNENLEQLVAPIQSEIRSLRSLLRSSKDQRTPKRAARRTESASEQTAANRPSTPVWRGSPKLDHQCISPKLVSPSRRRVVAMVGSAGVGKTTTIAKLATQRALVEHNSVAIVSIDNYRVGGEEQIRAFSDLIGVPLFFVSPHELSDKIRDLARYDYIFIDTAGRSPRDSEGIAELREALVDIDDLEIHLCVSMATSPASITHNFSSFRSLRLNRLLFTKVDEAVEYSELVQAPTRLGLPIAYITTGQRVPEDIEDAQSDRILALSRSSLAPQGMAA